MNVVTAPLTQIQTNTESQKFQVQKGKFKISMSDQQLISQLIAGDPRAIEDFFFVRCRAMLTYIGQYFCQSTQSPEELIGEFYEFLSADDWHKLRIFQYSCSLNSYISIIAARYFQHKRDQETIPLDDVLPFVEDIQDNATDETFLMEDIQQILEKMPPFDRFLLQRILIDGTKPRDVLDEAREYVLHEPSLKTKAKDKDAFAGYIYTRYNRARKSLQHQLNSMGYGR